jgi:acyl-[acyl-carrier-protein]-phospholipid O-acyltransferase/long-chain-fatty-acid--[acyl-carrier-protein] ligase
MLGYLKASQPDLIEPPARWYDTGDIVTVDADGFVTILDRARRFAKIGGEMVPLAPAEELTAAVWPRATHAVVAIPDETRGEQLVLATTERDADVAHLRAAGALRRIPSIALPRRIMVMPRLPQLGSGKADHPALLRAIGRNPGSPEEHPAAAFEAGRSG